MFSKIKEGKVQPLIVNELLTGVLHVWSLMTVIILITAMGWARFVQVHDARKYA